MFCKVCKRDRVAKNSFTTRGCANLRKSAITEHSETADHRRALQTPELVRNRERVELSQLSREENAISHAIRGLHWMIKEDMPLAKYPSFLGLLNEYPISDLDILNVSQTANYSTRDTATDILETLAEDDDDEANSLLKEAPFISVLADESTDLMVKKRMGVFVVLFHCQFLITQVS